MIQTLRFRVCEEYVARTFEVDRWFQKLGGPFHRVPFLLPRMPRVSETVCPENLPFVALKVHGPE